MNSSSPSHYYCLCFYSTLNSDDANNNPLFFYLCIPSYCLNFNKFTYSFVVFKPFGLGNVDKKVLAKLIPFLLLFSLFVSFALLLILPFFIDYKLTGFQFFNSSSSVPLLSLCSCVLLTVFVNGNFFIIFFFIVY